MSDYLLPALPCCAFFLLGDRARPLPCFGGIAFVSAGAVAPRYGAFSMADVRHTGGVGLRYFLLPKKDIFLRFDLGVTPGSVGFYISTGKRFRG